ncbi:MAG TPA: PEGA domain-containing protein [Kiritimatiellia bacterium]|nr:PEGA domain-containing protein [Kiritimatiellia bacterium]
MNKLGLIAWMVIGACGAARAEAPIRVAVLDFENRAASLPSSLPASAASPQALAEKGAFLLNKQLAGQEGFRLIDRRDFFAQIDKLKTATSVDPSFLRAAQQVNADVVLRGSLLAVSSSRSSVQQGGYSALLDDVTVRVGLEALDVRDGAVLAAADGAASRRFRQTENVQTMLGEDDFLQLMAAALDDTIPAIRDALDRKREEIASRPTVLLSVTTTDDPALVEIDGILIGTTPIVDFVVYRGDHTITIGKPGHRDVSKRILLENDTRIEVPLLRTELSADELKEVLEGARLNIYSGVEPAWIIQTVE